MRNYNHLAIGYIEEYVKKRINAAKDSIDQIAKMSNISTAEIKALQKNIKNKARIAIHFHPYRIGKNGKTVLELLAKSGKYQNQFETKTSNGSLTAYRGGERDVWENLLFGQIFKQQKVPDSLRPKYGSLALTGHPDGPSPRFGSCYFLTKSELTHFASFTYLDSYKNPPEKGTINTFEEILACFLLECFERDHALGEHQIRPDELVKRINQYLNQECPMIQEKTLSKNLDHYIEAQIHTEISLSKDIDYLVADTAYRHTPYENLFHQISEAYSIALIWNKGRELAIKDIPNNFRGPQIPSIAKAITSENKINAYTLALAERKYKEEIGDEKALQDANQQLKYLWHTLVKYGTPID